MALVEVNGLSAFDSQLVTPRVGAWVFDMRVDSPDVISGQVEISINGGARTLKGTAFRTGNFVGTAQLRVLAGAGSIGVPCRPNDYNGTTLGGVLRDILSSVGETLSPTADASVLATPVASWTTLGKPAGIAIEDLFSAVAPMAVWRFLDDGTVWVGVDDWADSGVDPSTYEVLDRADDDDWIEVAVAAPLDIIGTTFEGSRVSYTQADVPHIDGVKMKIIFDSGEVDPLWVSRNDFAALVRASPPGLDHRFRYLADVVAQAGGTVDARPVIPGVPEVQAAQLLAQAGDSVDGVTGGQVAVGWAGDGTQRVAHGFTADALPSTRLIKVLVQLVLGDSTAPEPFLKAITTNAAWATLAGAFATYLAGIKAIADPTGLLTPPMLAALGAFTTALAAAGTLKVSGT